MSVANAKPNDHDMALGQVEKNKLWQRELLMERLRSHPLQQKTFAELSKAMRMSMLEKRYALDAVEKSNLQKCLDSMQHCIKVTSRQGLVERLESLSRQLGLKFMEDTSGLFISSDMFYLEIILDANGVLSDVKVHHECKIEQQSCSELVTCLLNGDFADFTVQLEGLSSIYQLNAEAKVKSKAFIALQAMETDLYNLFQVQPYSSDIQALVMGSEVGAVLKRRGGHPMKLTYFISPYDLISLETKSMMSLNMELLSRKQVGMSVTVNLEASSANKLQILPIVQLNKDQQGVSCPTYAALTAINSTLLPATFVLRLNKPLPVLESLLKTILTSTESADIKPTCSIMKLIVQTASNGLRESFSKGLFVSLPDQNHCYFFTDNLQLKASMVSSVPFTEPSQVPKIVSLLRKQAMFYTLMASCVRTQGKMGDMERTTIIEVNAISINQISVAFEHPYEEAMAMVEFDLSNVSNVTCQIYTLSTNYEYLTAKLSKVVQVSLSIPVTIRALLKLWDQEQMKMVTGSGLEKENFNLSAGPNDPGGRSSDFRDLNNVKNVNRTEMQSSFTTNSRQFFHTSGMAMNTGMDDDFGHHNMFNVDPNAALLKQFKTEVKQEDFCKSPKSISVPSEHSDDSTSLGLYVAQTDGIVATESTSFNYHADSSYSGALAGVCTQQTLQDRYDVLADKYQKIWKDKTNLKNSVSITPIPTVVSPPDESNLHRQNLPARQGIEIIPIQTQNVSQSTFESTSKSDKKLSSLDKKSPPDNIFKSEKKRKKKRDSSPMGPPEKVFSRQNSPISEPSTTGLSRKFQTPSTSSSSPKSSSSSISVLKVSPKHSPVYCSPKHLNSPNSPFGTVSPKHGSSGKPSMSTLKIVTSPRSSSPSSSYTSKSLSSSNREKDRSSPLSNKNSSSTKLKIATVKLKPIDLIAKDDVATASGLHKSSTDMNAESSGSGSSSGKARKGSLSAVIDKLKSAQASGDDVFAFTTSPVDPKPLEFRKSTDLSKSTKVSSDAKDSSNSEYMIKPSPDGMKITINKTRTKESSSSSSSSSSKTSSSSKSSKSASPSTSSIGSPKKHTGLKPGITSGPASKKNSPSSSSLTSSSNPKSSSTSSSSSSSLQVSTKHAFQKSNSSGSLSSFPSGSKSSSKSHPLTKSLSTNSFNVESFRKDSKSSLSSSNKPRPPDKQLTGKDSTDVMKILQFASPNNVAIEGFVKSLNTKFQIPKLSARNNPPTTSSSTVNGVVDKFSDIAKRSVEKPIDDKAQIVEPPKSAPICSTNQTQTKRDDHNMRPPATMHPTTTNPKPIDVDMPPQTEKTGKPIEMNATATTAATPSAPPSRKVPLTTANSISNKISSFPASPSVSLHILKSPSPLMVVLPSPHSNSPGTGITDDELMDEALCGIGSK